MNNLNLVTDIRSITDYLVSSDNSNFIINTYILLNSNDHEMWISYYNCTNSLKSKQALDLSICSNLENISHLFEAYVNFTIDKHFSLKRLDDYAK